MSTQKHTAIMQDGKRVTMISMEQITESQAKQIMETKFFTTIKMEPNHDNNKKQKTLHSDRKNPKCQNQLHK